MVNIEQCKFCNLPFQSIGSKICPNCLDKIDQDFITIRDYLYDNPGASDLDAISSATEVQKRVILHLIKEKRLTLTTAQGGLLSCTLCKKPISDGTMCESCKSSMASALSTVSPPPAPEVKTPKLREKKGAIMHVRRNDKTQDKK